VTYADRFTRTAAKRAKYEDIPLPSTKEMKEALLNKQMRRLKPAGKRHGKGFAEALTVYAGVVKAARADVKDINRYQQNDETEKYKLAIIGETRANWSSVAPPRATQRKSKVTPKKKETK